MTLSDMFYFCSNGPENQNFVANNYINLHFTANVCTVHASEAIGFLVSPCLECVDEL